MLTALKKIPFPVQVLVGLVLGIALGLIAKATEAEWLGTTLTAIGSTFVDLLTLAVVPLVFTAIVVSISNLRGINGGGRTVARLGGKTLMWFLITSLIAVMIGLAVGLISNPGQGVQLNMDRAKVPDETGSWTDFFANILPSDIVSAFNGENILQVVFLGIAIGAAAYAVGDKAEPFVDLNRSLLEVVQKALWWVIRLAPIGSMGLIGKATSQYGWELLRPFATFTVAVYVGSAIVMFAVYPLLLRVFGRVSPLQFFRNAWPALQLAFVSRSSVGTMPLTQRITTEKLGVSSSYASFAIPFGATTKMDACASVYPAIAAIFVAQVYGVPLGITEYLLIVFVAVIGSAATAGLTGSIVMLTLTLSTLGLPLAGVGLLIAVDPIVDMMRTATNVAGQMTVPVVVARSENMLDDETYNGTRSGTEDTQQAQPATV